MPAAREALLEAAGAALVARPWTAVRMVEVAAAAGVSRQTLYNEFGGKEGLGRALVRRETDWYLAGVDRALAPPARPEERLAALADWTVRAAREHPLVRAVLTGCWDSRLPPAVPAGTSWSGAATGPPGPGEMARAVRDRAAAALSSAPEAGGSGGSAAAGVRQCELAVRLALSYVIAPPLDPADPDLVTLLAP
ncbi:TetR/AcrR family transcriptional regulator [Streptomyces sp. NPDC090022]|uniref:TetR/AcrR family transcriptional regulator n=1 Tax=Streptomyces sp. NPDC090022 TaxID=3365920 RepID=UPI003806DF79